MKSNVKVKVKINPEFARSLGEDLKKAMSLTMEDLNDDLVTSQTMPFKDGTLQESNNYFTVSDGSSVTGVLWNGLPYSRYQFMGMSRKGNPLNYNTAKNPYARSHWLEPYCDGAFLTERCNANLKKVREDG